MSKPATEYAAAWAATYADAAHYAPPLADAAAAAAANTAAWAADAARKEKENE